MKKYLRWFLLLFVLLLLTPIYASVGDWLLLVFNDKPYIEVLEPPYLTNGKDERTKVFEVTDRVYVHWKLKKNRNCSVIVERWIINHEAVKLAGHSGILDIGNNEIVISFDIPNRLQSGVYLYHTVVKPKCHPLYKDRPVNLPKIPFRVINPKEDITIQLKRQVEELQMQQKSFLETK